MSKMILDFDRYCQIARQAVAEGQVLVKNDNRALPLKEQEKVAVFGRIQSHYYKSGTGSGGMVNVSKVTGIPEALQESGRVQVNERLIRVYEEWEKEHPFDEGIGWGNEPWCQQEMPLTEELAGQIAEESSTAIVIIGRTAGEDQDNRNQPGSYFVTEEEEAMMKTVRKHFAKMIVVLNTGNIMDMGFEDSCHPDAVLYAWQGGMIGGLGTADVLTGQVSPSGKLTDTIAYHMEDYPSHANFGDGIRDVYEEDIYVGYRYFETAARDKVRYPFGFGLSYTEFTIESTGFVLRENEAVLSFTVKNTGSTAGKEVVQVYVQPPQGKLGKPLRNLAGFVKTKELSPGESRELSVTVPFYRFSSYDETGITGYASSYVLEQGTYFFYAGNSVSEVKPAGSFELSETRLIEKHQQALAPVEGFERFKPKKTVDGSFAFEREQVPVRVESPTDRRFRQLPKELPYTGDCGYRLADVKAGKVSIEEFVAQFSDEDLSCIIRGEGMGSPKVTPGTAAAFGGVTESLKNFGVPCGCCSDGPSGMRLDSGMKAFSLPNGTLLASTFHEELMEELYSFTGVEMVKNKIDILLGPGMNLHRHPLNGRNFEYFSEDPLVTGKMAAAMIRGLKRAGVTGAAKHFCANNRETKRHEMNSVVSERALREIYLKGFEIAVKESGADAIMTTYGAVNGLWTAGSYDLNTTLLRGEWGFEGFVMTDWWAKINEEGKEASGNNFAAMARAQNDVYMVCSDASVNGTGDNTLTSLSEGTLTRGELQRNAANICRFLMHTQAFDRMQGIKAEVEVLGEEVTADWQNEEVKYHKVEDEIVISLADVKAEKDSDFVFALDLDKIGGYTVEITAKSDLGELAQMPVTLFYQSVPMASFIFNGSKGEWDTRSRKVVLHNKYAVLRLFIAQNGLTLKDIKFTFHKPVEEIDSFEEYMRS